MMRSIQTSNRNLGIQNAQPSAKTIVRLDSDRSPLSAFFGALYGYESRALMAMRDSLRHWRKTATRVLKTRVTGGVLSAIALQAPGRHAATCRLAAR
jgi:hypothetical protein